MDYNDIIAQAIAQNQGVVNQGPVPSVPSVNTGTPLIDDSTLRATIARALQPASEAQVPQEDLLSARMKMFTALAQPRMQGQSVAGNVTSALNTGVEATDAARQRAAVDAAQKGQMASAIAGQDALRRTQEANLNMAVQKFPQEMEELRLKINALVAQGQVAQAAALRAKVMAHPDIMAQTIKQEMETKAASTEKETAQATEATAKAGFYDRGGAAKSGMTAVGDGTFIRQGVAPDGTTFMEHVIPGNPNYTEEMARKELVKKAKADAPWWQPGMFLPDPSPQDIATLVAQRKTDQVQKFAPIGGAPTTPTTPGTPTPSTASGTPPPIDITAEVRKIQGKNPDGSSRAASGKIIGVKPGQDVPVTPEKSPGALQTSLKVDPTVQLARDQQAIAILQQELQDAESGVSGEDPVKIQVDLAHRMDRVKKMQLALAAS